MSLVKGSKTMSAGTGGEMSVKGRQEAEVHHFNSITDGQSSEMGRNEVLMLLGLPGLSRGMIVDVFQMSGIVHVQSGQIKNGGEVV